MCYPHSVLMIPANCLLLLDPASMSGNLNVFLYSNILYELTQDQAIVLTPTCIISTVVGGSGTPGTTPGTAPGSATDMNHRSKSNYVLERTCGCVIHMYMCVCTCVYVFVSSHIHALRVTACIIVVVKELLADT